MPDRTYTCIACGLEFNHTASRGPLPRWCPEDRPYIPTQRGPKKPPDPVALSEQMALVLTEQRLAIELARDALTLAALARHLEWDDSTWLQAALDHLSDVVRVR